MSMRVIVKDFFQLGSLRLITHFVKGLRGLFIITSLTPVALGEYTIWLLYFFYFSFIEFGVSKGLERDLSHSRGQKDERSIRSVANTGWSTYFLLSLIASLSLMVVSYCIFKQWVLALFLAGYLFTDKMFRAYDTNSRIYFRYTANGIADLIQVIVGFAMIIYLLPRYGIYSIFPSFIVSLIIGSIYLAYVCRIDFRWTIDLRKSFLYIKDSLSLAVMFYSIQIFHLIPMTIVAFLWDKATLGYYAFAFRIFQICLVIFPFLIREVMRTRMYFHLAENEDKQASILDLVYPMSIYGLVVTSFWGIVYWWTPFTVMKYAPEYMSSIGVLNVLLVSLLPLGINKICSDYLCSRIFNKTAFVIGCWVAGILFQVVCIFGAERIFSNAFHLVPVIYVIGTFLVYFSIVGFTFKIGKKMREAIFNMGYLLMPLIVVSMAILMIRYFFDGIPTLNAFKNGVYCTVTVFSALIFSFWHIWLQNHQKTTDYGELG